MVAKKLSVFRRFLMVGFMAMSVLTAVHIAPALECAEAAVIEFSGSLGPVSPNQNTYIDVSQFNPSLGTLTSATFTLTGDFAGTYSFTNNSASPVTAYWGQMGDISISYGSMTASASVSNPNIPIDEWYNGIHSNNLNTAGTVAANGGTLTGPTITMNPSQQFTFTAPGDLSALIGSGTLPFNFVADQTSQTVMGGGNGVQEIDTFVSGTITADYTYTPVPIPGSFLLFGAGLLGLAGISRRVKK
jgi:hypothetical protein